MDQVRHIDPTKDTTIPQLLDAMHRVGVLGAGRLGRATKIVKRMFEDKDCFTYLALSGPMVPGGLRRVISHLVQLGHVDAIISSGANIVHDLVEAYKGAHFRVPIEKSDKDLREAGMGRIADIFVKESDFEVFEKGIYKFLDDLPDEKMERLSPSEFLMELGQTISDEDSIVHQAAVKSVPIFSPGLMDSMLGFHLYTYSTAQNLRLDFIKDLRILGERVTEAKSSASMEFMVSSQEVNPTVGSMCWAWSPATVRLPLERTARPRTESSTGERSWASSTTRWR